MSVSVSIPQIEDAWAVFKPTNRAVLESLKWIPRPTVKLEGIPYRVWAALVPDHHRVWELWRLNRDLMKARGLRVNRDCGGGWWLEVLIPDEGAASAAIVESTKIQSDLVVPTPASLAYYPFQRAGIEFLASRKEVLLADEMGCGKSIQIAGLLNYLGTALGRILLVVPASMKIVWALELSRWLVNKEVPIMVIKGATPPEDLPLRGIWIVNYELLPKFHEARSGGIWDLMVLDEGHFIKSRSSIRTKACFNLASHAKRRVLLTGTPLLNRPAELWALLHFLSPLEWPHFYRFAHRYCAPFRGEWGWDFSGASNLEELNERLRSGLMLRRLKKDVLSQLPPLTRSLVPLDVGTGDLEALTRAAGLDPLAMPWEIDPLSIPFDCVAKIRHELGRLKVKAALEYIREQASGYDEKFVIFAHHLAVLHELADGLEGSVLVSGETRVEDRAGIIERFQSDPEIRFFVASIRAMGVGVTLTAASRAIFIEQDWVPAIMRQAEGRLHRISQDRPVLSQYLVVPDSIDINIMRSVTAKMEVITRAIEKHP